MKKQDQVIVALTELQRLVRMPSVESASELANAVWFASDPEEETEETSSGRRAIGLNQEEVGAAVRLRNHLVSDLRFEQIADATGEVERFISNCMKDRETDHVRAFVDEHARIPGRKICYIPVTDLAVQGETEVFGIRLLPPSSTELPINPGQLSRASPPLR